jgi:hypothetical protein
MWTPLGRRIALGLGAPLLGTPTGFVPRSFTIVRLPMPAIWLYYTLRTSVLCTRLMTAEQDMATFSERAGLKPAKTVLQKDSMDDALRNRLWNVLIESLWNRLSDRYWPGSAGDKFCQHLWHVHFGEPMDRRPHDYYGVRAEVRSRYFKWEWNEVYDFIEFVARYHPDDYQGGFAKECNRVLEKELSAYRFVKEILVPITSDQELQAVQKALELKDALKPVKVHISTAVKFFADRKAPDYRTPSRSPSVLSKPCAASLWDPRRLLGRL